MFGQGKKNTVPRRGGAPLLRPAIQGRKKNEHDDKSDKENQTPNVQKKLTPSPLNEVIGTTKKVKRFANSPTPPDEKESIVTDPGSVHTPSGFFNTADKLAQLGGSPLAYPTAKADTIIDPAADRQLEPDPFEMPLPIDLECKESPSHSASSSSTLTNTHTPLEEGENAQTENVTSFSLGSSDFTMPPEEEKHTAELSTPPSEVKELAIASSPSSPEVVAEPPQLSSTPFLESVSAPSLDSQIPSLPSGTEEEKNLGILFLDPAASPRVTAETSTLTPTLLQPKSSLAFDPSDDLDTRARKRIKQLCDSETSKEIIAAIDAIDLECETQAKSEVAVTIKSKLAAFKAALANNDEYDEITTENRNQFIETLSPSYHALCDLLEQHKLHQNNSVAPPQVPISGSTKLIACLGILVAALSGAFIGAALGSIAGPGGTVAGAVKGAIHAGGLAAKLGGGTLGALTTGGGLSYYLRHTLFPSTTQVPVSEDSQVKTILEKGDRLVAVTDTQFPALKRT